MKVIIAVIVASVILGGCATRAGYQWSQYDQKLYDYYKAPGTAEQFLADLEAHVRTLDQSGVKPPPGLYAEVGTLYLHKGERANAIAYFKKEAAAWPESRSLMIALVTNLEKTGEKQ
jgi:hypothetical protein